MGPSLDPSLDSLWGWASPPPAQEPQAQACVLGPHPAPWPLSETATSLTVRELSFLGYLCLNKTFIHLLSILIDLNLGG